MLTVKGVHPARFLAIGKLTNCLTVVGNGFHIVAGGITPRQACVAQCLFEEILHSSTGLDLVGLGCDPGLQISASQGVYGGFTAAVLIAALQREGNADSGFQCIQCCFRIDQSLVIGNQSLLIRS